MSDSDALSLSLADPGSVVGTLRETGRLPFARWCPSPNFGPRPEDAAISLLVVHNISLPPGQFGGPEIENFFCNCLDHSAHPYFEAIAGVQVSAHLLIRRDGSVVQFVSLLDRAWHAGRSSFEGREECNDFSIGIELEGADDVPYSSDQYLQLASISDLIMHAWPDITAGRITGHCDIAPGRKTDPGPAFDWAHFRNVLNRTRSAREGV
ncbi:1,6-anhydro-N-acetylmuramyl-L-alanine amidase AmpD [Marinobacter subterrani]|uniref:1,6-anhydro-N-acetylmuramyl-L-alanine amidase AmpD n=1 Tax=Marinobacter subterrani TaxID=1658765 RepID=UPI002355735A|nr:1,6-anhydro-N-acetylmuramyl-L-alanine amidase AmpD [Marinobacter subterrani]